jgi:hypothetical protein
MAIKSRADLKISFTKGRRPKQQEFWDWQESYYHKTEDPIKIGGWQFRSFFKDMRAEGITITTNGVGSTTGGSSAIDIPMGVTRLKRIRVMGRGTPAVAATPFTITTSLVYFSDKNLPALNGVVSTGNPFPTTMFAHFLLGINSIPLTNFTINTVGPQFDGIFDFATIPKDVFMDFTQARSLVLTIRITNGTFPNTAVDPSYIYCGLEYE